MLTKLRTKKPFLVPENWIEVSVSVELITDNQEELLNVHTLSPIIV